jgi:menaquinone-9 beta-reductase
MTTERTEVVVVGGGPAGALTAMLLARAGREVVLLERAPRWRWRACGVFTSPASVAALRGLGVPVADLALVARPLPAMEVVTRGGVRFRLTYGASGDLADAPVGFDRGALDPLLLDLARRAGVDVREGVAAERMRLGHDQARVDPARAASEPARAVGQPNEVDDDPPGSILARLVVGADGLRSRVATTAGVTRSAPLGPRAALTFHVPETRAAPSRAAATALPARMCVVEDGYVGLAPVPGGRVNVGIVLGRSWFARLRRLGAGAVARGLLERLPAEEDRILATAEPLDRVAGVTPIGHAVSHRAGQSWLLVGDASGFLDPFTGEGLHRAIASAELAAGVIDDVLGAVPGATPMAYDRAMSARFGQKDVVSRLVLGFLGRPALFEYAARRLAARAPVRETMGLVIGDLEPAARALDPRFLAALLRP